MPTQIIDGFRLNAATPIDTRIVAANAAQRNNIQFKYEGLRVFDLTDKTGYVWLDGQWKEEGTTSKTGNTGGGFGGGGGAGGSALGTLDRVPKFSATGLTNSIITESLKNGQYFVGIGKQQTSFKLEVDGSVKATSFIGNIDGGYVVVDSLPLDRIKKPTAAGNYLLKYDGTSVVWATETAAASVGVTNTTAPSATHYLLFSESAQSTSATLRANQHDPTKLLGFKPDTAQILATPLDIPAYSFVGQTSTGFYGTATEVGVKIQDKKVFNALGAQTNIGILNSTGGVPQLVGSIAMTINNVKIAQQTIIRDYVKIDVVSTTPRIEFSGSKFSVVNNPNGQLVERLGYIDLTYGNVSNFGTGFVSGTNHALRMVLKNVAGDTTEYAGVQVLMNTSGKKYVRIASTLGDTQAASGMILQSTDANGTLGWASLPASVPYGSIIIWHRGQATIPDGWKVCNGVGYIYLSQVNVFGSTSMEYVKVPDYRDFSIFGLPDGYTDMDGSYGTLSPTVVNHSFKLAGGQLPAHVHFSRLPKHRHAMKGSTDAESSTTNITSSGSHTHKLYSDMKGPDKGPSNKVDVSNQDGNDPYELGNPYIQASSHTHDKENFDGYTSFRVYDNNGFQNPMNPPPNEVVYFNTGPSSNWQDIDKPDTQWTNLNAFGGTLASISIPQRKAKVVLFIIKYNPNATQNQDGHFSFSSTGADAPAPSPSPSPSPGGGLTPNFPTGGITGETGGVGGGGGLPPYVSPSNNG